MAAVKEKAAPLPRPSAVRDAEAARREEHRTRMEAGRRLEAQRQVFCFFLALLLSCRGLSRGGCHDVLSEMAGGKSSCCCRERGGQTGGGGGAGWGEMEGGRVGEGKAGSRENAAGGGGTVASGTIAGIVVCVYGRVCSFGYVSVYAYMRVYKCSHVHVLRISPLTHLHQNLPFRCSKTKRKRWSEQRSSQLYHWCLTWAPRLTCARPEDRMWPL